MDFKQNSERLQRVLARLIRKIDCMLEDDTIFEESDRSKFEIILQSYRIVKYQYKCNCRASQRTIQYETRYLKYPTETIQDDSKIAL